MTGRPSTFSHAGMRGQRVDQLDDPGGEHVGIGRRALASDLVGGQRLEVHGHLQAGLLRAVEDVAQPPQVPAAADLAALPRHDHGVDAGAWRRPACCARRRPRCRWSRAAAADRAAADLPRRRDPTTDTSARAPADRDGGPGSGPPVRSSAMFVSRTSPSTRRELGDPRRPRFVVHVPHLDAGRASCRHDDAIRRSVAWFDDTTRRKVALAAAPSALPVIATPSSSIAARAIPLHVRLRDRADDERVLEHGQPRGARRRGDPHLDADGIDDGLRQRLRMARRGRAGNLEHGRGQHEASDTHAPSIGRPEAPVKPVSRAAGRSPPRRA